MWGFGPTQWEHGVSRVSAEVVMCSVNSNNGGSFRGHLGDVAIQYLPFWHIPLTGRSFWTTVNEGVYII
jgi:hypothetical protein